MQEKTCTISLYTCWCFHLSDRHHIYFQNYPPAPLVLVTLQFIVATHYIPVVFKLQNTVEDIDFLTRVDILMLPP